MKITFLGTGEACDPLRRNTSILVEAGDRKILLDCGFTSVQPLLTQGAAANLDTIWISHFHGDHFFGFPQLLAHYHMAGRTATLTVMSGCDCRETISLAVNLAYRDLMKKINFPIVFVELTAGQSWSDNTFSWLCAPMAHSEESCAVKLSGHNHSLFYSGDGKTTADSERLMCGSSLAVHEAFSISPSKPTHSSIEECLELAKRIYLKRLALVHISHETRLTLDTMSSPIAPPPCTTLLIPKDGDILTLGCL